MRRTIFVSVVLAVVTAACSLTSTGALDPPPEAWPEQREIVYPWLGRGDTTTADLIRSGVWDLPRFDPVELAYPPTWTEDPYDENYWRFVFYGLRPLRHLIAAYDETGDIAYLETLAEILESFADERDASPHLTDPHAAAFRTMVQVESYGVLGRAGLLDDDLEATLRNSIGADAAFLAKPENYQGDYNHGFTEAAALLLVAETFPDPRGWGEIARDRLDALMVDVVDADGVEVENSPFYHFYVLKFVRDIAAWADRNEIELSPTVPGGVDRMLEYATWIVMPNGEIPLIGSSVIATVHGLDTDDPHFDFVQSRGTKGEPPDGNSIIFPVSGTSIMRSGFGDSETYGDQTHIVFDVGAYRTNHSHLDALSVNIFGAGTTVFPDSGLFTYESGADFDYFHGTAAHNTVVVDGSDQAEGDVDAGLTETGDGWSYQSGSHDLYNGVTHRRAITLVGTDLIAVIDLLDASGEHEFSQLWHSGPELEMRVEERDVVAATRAGVDIARIEQAADGGVPELSSGDNGDFPGWYSERYEIKVPNPVAAYTVNASEARFVTLLALGPAAQPDAATITASGSGDDVELVICGTEANVSVSITDLVGPDESVTVGTATCDGSS
ncbi:MAG: alginate lyase family protein [Actinomycetota bacterium]